MKQAIGNTQISTEGTQIRLERYFNAPVNGYLLGLGIILHAKG